MVAMSGGVDSSVVAALLHEQGYQVIGITLQLYDHGQAVGKKGACCAGQDIHDARRVAESLGIPHYVLNYESKFRQSVVDDFVETYLSGETPIPCVKCNQSVKFRDLLDTAKDLGADAMATGHYVQRVMGTHKAELHRGLDPDRDQSYFLFATTQEQLDFLRFPLGGMHKTETRAHAARFGLVVQDKPDSQDICFVPTGGYASVIEKIRPGACDPGDIVHVNGEVLGQHNGIIGYTVGQRKGLGISAAEPLYVVKIDATANRVYVGPKESLLSSWLTAREANWLGDTPLEGCGDKVYQVRLRSSQTPLEATIHAAEGGKIRVELVNPQHAIAPGQACVIYDGDRVLGGGWITSDHQGAGITMPQSQKASATTAALTA